MSVLAPWLQTSLENLLPRQGHAWLIQGSSGLGQYELALALATGWLCHAPTPKGACGECPSCHGIDIRVHADFRVLMPETELMARAWPLNEKAEKEIDDKKRKPSREIRVDAMREMLDFCHMTRSGERGKVVLIYPAEQMNNVTANTLLKTLEEPPPDTRFILATSAAHELLPTIRSRCLVYTLHWPDSASALTWLSEQSVPSAEAAVLLRAAGGRAHDALDFFNQGVSAKGWAGLPKMLLRGEAGWLVDAAPDMVLSVLQKLSHDMLALACGTAPRFFEAADLPKPAGLNSLTQWSRELMDSARTVDHPFNPGLLLQAWVSRAQRALNAT
ncbi:MAG: DNA polymerase III subunit delta' [Betaproteobacteria bacterium]|nr:DNA polymerase III subunit delta' [Betaproteobacteria bacterium]